MEKETPASNPSHQSMLSDDQLSIIERNLELSVDERINQLQSAVELIEEMRSSLKEINEKKSSSYEMIKSNDISTIKLGRNLICIVNNANNYYELLKKFKKL